MHQKLFVVAFLLLLLATAPSLACGYGPPGEGCCNTNGRAWYTAGTVVGSGSKCLGDNIWRHPNGTSTFPGAASCAGSLYTTSSQPVQVPTKRAAKTIRWSGPCTPLSPSKPRRPTSTPWPTPRPRLTPTPRPPEHEQPVPAPAPAIKVAACPSPKTTTPLLGVVLLTGAISSVGGLIIWEIRLCKRIWNRRTEARRKRERRRENYRRAVLLLTKFHWDEGIQILEEISPGYRRVVSLLEQAKRGVKLDGLCAKAKKLANAGQWVKAKSALEQVPPNWMGLFNAEELRQWIEVEAAAASLGDDYYKILGVPQNAGQEQIKQAYRQLARQHHPDANGKPEGEACFKRINEAYEVTSDSEKRREYDQTLALLAWADQFRRGT